MSENITTITDAGQYEKLFNQYFVKNPSFLRTRSGNLKIKYYGFSDARVGFMVPYVKHMTSECVIFCVADACLVHAYLAFSEQQGDDLYLFTVIKLQIISRARMENRKSLQMEGDAKSILYVTGLITDFIIENSLALYPKHVDRVKERVQYDLSRYFNYLKVFMASDRKIDVRMAHFKDKKSIIFIPSVMAQSEDSESMLNYYLNNIYTHDPALVSNRKLVSEISVPILFRGKIPYGYVQVNNERPFETASLGIVKKMALFIDEFLNKYGVFPVGEERLLVYDISKNGIGIVFNERKFIRYFKKGSLLFFDLLLPDTRKAGMLVVVRNIDLLENKLIKVGCQIRGLDALSEVVLDEFLEKMGLGIPGEAAEGGEKGEESTAAETVQ